ncbi:MAG: putative ABC exporter domain-containing protein [bacterium]
MIGAFAYLIIASARNTVRSRIKQLKNPRYAIALVLGLGYFYLVFFQRSARAAQPNPLASETFGALIPVAVLLYVATIWIFGADRAALAFSPAEVSMLFTAPVSRRGLVIYKLIRAQTAVLTTSILWLIIFHRSGSGTARVVSSWIFLTTLSMHRLGVALLRASQAEHGAKGLRRHWLPITIFTTVVGVVVYELYAARTRFATAALGDLGQVIVSEFSTGPLNWVLYPFRVAVAPMFTHATAAWLNAVGTALVLLALHVVWVLRSDSAFEEAAADASAYLAKRRQHLRTRGATGGVDPKKARRTIALSPTGAPEIALVWKNYLWLIRTGQIRVIFLLPGIALTCALAFAGRSEMAEVVVVAGCAVIAFFTLLFGPMTMRNDLRAELLHLPLLKSMPLKGRQIMLAAVASSASPIALMQLLTLTAAMIALSFIPKNPLPLDARVGLFVAAPVFLLGLNFANFTIHNGMALLFPAWVRLGAGEGNAGVEVMGQMMLTLIITLVLLATLCIVPAIAAGSIYLAMHWPQFFAVAGAGIVAGIAFGVEAYLLISALGGSLDRLEPMQVG